MTSPKINTIKRGGSRLYVHPESAKKVPGVTSVLNMLPKPFLRFWASKVSAEYAVENLGAVVSLAMTDRSAATDLIKRAPDRFTAAAAGNGNEAHALFERMARGQELGRVTPDLIPYVEIFRGFEKTYRPEFLFIEDTVWSETYGYAGSFDFIAKVTDPDTTDRMTVVGDWKTTRSGVHSEVALQETAYAFADYIILPDGSKHEIPEIDGGLVVHAARADKNGPADDSNPIVGQVVPARIGEDLFEIFKALLAVWEWDRETSKTALGGGMPIEVEEKPKRRTRAAR